jgi:hypothetical protein
MMRFGEGCGDWGNGPFTGRKCPILIGLSGHAFSA